MQLGIRLAMWLALTLLLGLSACGGGGGGSDGSSSTNSDTPVSISVQPVPQTLTEGLTATFSVTAGGTGVVYQWQSSADGQTWSDLAQQVSASLMLSQVALADSGRSYRVKLSNSQGSLYSNAATLTVTARPVSPLISTAPASTSVVAPATAIFSVVASGTPAPAYQWQQSTNGGTSFTDIAGATGASYTTGATTTADSGRQYRVVVSNTAGSVTSTAATLSVSPAPALVSISTQPHDVTVTEPATATFTVVATGSPAPTYQWQLSTNSGANFTNINGATSASYTTPATTAADSGRRYQVIVSNNSGSVPSAVASLTVTSAAPLNSSSCFDLTRLETVGTGSVVTYDYVAGSKSGTLTESRSVGAATSFNGTLAYVQQNDLNLSVSDGTVSWHTTGTEKTYTQVVYGSLMEYGSTRTEDSTTSTSLYVAKTEITNVLTPALLHAEIGLAAGASATLSSSQTRVVTLTTTLNGKTVVSPHSTTTTTTLGDAVTFIGQQTLSLAAGSFQACQFEHRSNGQLTAREWLLAGRGVVLQRYDYDSTTGALSTSKVARTVSLH